MAVRAIRPDYDFEPRDLQKHYGDNILIYVGWDHHTLYCAAHAMLVSPQQTFQEFLDQQMQAGFYQHPDFEHINWDEVQFKLNQQAIQPRPEQTLAEIGFDHKSLLRFVTPGLKGYQGAHV
ncbi:phenol hydroxylase subunit P4 [Acinetobacter sp. RF14B]|uniref:phenol hydroxylase subunit P4 n=1 Tax=Acinetobacter sp. RF14B TaxID=2650965 RepID=UPI001172CEEA|nr:phenol hydroxylase subunit P4 [Acinetobacter sp. RF14B]TQR65944.1 phenol hydroxylase [Acinetobacter sp. RF14B]